MSDGIWYKGKLIGSVHYFVYKDGKMPGGRDKDIFVRLDNLGVLETLIRLNPGSILQVGGTTRGDKITYEKFREEYLERVRDIRMDATGPDLARFALNQKLALAKQKDTLALAKERKKVRRAR